MWDITELDNKNRDLTIAKERAEESDRLKSAFLANMSHEIRTPLNSIVGFSEMIAYAETEEEKENCINVIHANNDMLIDIINDVIDLSKIGSGCMEIRKEKFDLADFFNNLDHSFSSKIHNDDVKLEISSPYKECIIDSDSSKILQIISNYYSNALKNTESGVIKIGYSVEKGGVRIYVEDTGRGIPRDKLSKIFQRFEKIDNFSQGTGLGLSLAKSLSKLLGGDAGVKSKLGSGSTFYSFIPTDVNCENGDDKDVISSSRGVINIERVKKKSIKNIIIAEDNDDNFLLASNIFNRNKITRATNGKEVVKMVKDGQYDLVLMDIKMPVMDGLSAAKAIRKFNSEICIIAITAYAYDTDVQEVKKSGCDDFIVKPIDVPKLKELLGIS